MQPVTGGTVTGLAGDAEGMAVWSWLRCVCGRSGMAVETTVLQDTEMVGVGELTASCRVCRPLSLWERECDQLPRHLASTERPENIGGMYVGVTGEPS